MRFSSECVLVPKAPWKAQHYCTLHMLLCSQVIENEESVVVAIAYHRKVHPSTGSTKDFVGEQGEVPQKHMGILKFHVTFVQSVEKAGKERSKKVYNFFYLFP